MNLTDQQMKETYYKAFGRQYDDPNRKQYPLPLPIAYKVAFYRLQNLELKNNRQL